MAEPEGSSCGYRRAAAGLTPGRDGTAMGCLPGVEESAASEAAPPARGLARAAAGAPVLDERNEVTYAEIPCRSVLNRCQSERLPFEWTINPYKGCEFGCHYCVAPETMVLHADMTWRPIGEVEPGDLLAGFDEYPHPGHHRKLRPSVVQSVWWSRRPTQRLVTERSEVETTAEHRWLQVRNYRWSRTEQLQPGRNLRNIGTTPHLEPDGHYRVGYIAGLSLGDRTFRYHPDWRSDRLGFPAAYWRVAITDLEPLERLRAYLADFGVETHIRPFAAETPNRRAIHKVEIRSLRRLRFINGLLRQDLFSESYRRGFLAGFFDAEGSNSESLRISQADRAVLERVQRYAARLGFHFEHESYTGHVGMLRLTGPLRERIRFFSTCQPAILRKTHALFGKWVEAMPDRVVAVEPGPVRDVVDIQTSTGTFYAAGLATHNCYARYTHEYLDLNGWLDFERKIFVKVGAEAVLEQEIGRRVTPGERIAIGTATDPYQPVERRFEVTRRLLEKMAARRGLVLSLTTKSDLVLRDLELLQAIHARSRLGINLTITTLDRRLARVLEPRAPTPERRLRAIARLSEAGLRVTLFIAPVMPEINDRPSDLEALVSRAADAGAREVMAQLLFLRSSSRKRFLPWLQEHFPHLQPLYRRLYAEGAPELAQREAGLRHTMGALRERYQLTQRVSEPLPPLGEQMTLPLD